MTQARSTSGLICPKCGGEMRAYERNNVTIDQCTECRGVFLDRGELDRLVDAESNFYRERGAPIDPDRAYGEHGRRGDDDDDDDYEHGGNRKRRRGGFLGGLFD